MSLVQEESGKALLERKKHLGQMPFSFNLCYNAQKASTGCQKCLGHRTQKNKLCYAPPYEEPDEVSYEE